MTKIGIFEFSENEIEMLKVALQFQISALETFVKNSEHKTEFDQDNEELKIEIENLKNLLWKLNCCN
jgi:hypothetical protein